MARNQLSQMFVLANEFKEGDLNVGGTPDDDVRREARDALAALSLEILPGLTSLRIRSRMLIIGLWIRNWRARWPTLLLLRLSADALYASRLEEEAADTVKN